MADRPTDPLVSTVTSTALLEGLKDPANVAVWQVYVDRYRPLIVACARRVGLDESDAEDVAQQALIAFCTSYREGKYHRSRGRLRDWLFGIARNQLRNWRRANARREFSPASQSQADDLLAGLADDDQLGALWEAQWRQALLTQCLALVRDEVGPETWRAFDLFARQGKPAQEVATLLGTTSNAVFIAKHRVLKAIRARLAQLEEDW